MRTMLQTQLRTTAISLALISSFFISTTASACDDKPCEAAYIAETKEHIKNHVRQAETYKTERHQHSSNRERRAYALYVHHYFMKHGWDYPESI